MQVLEKATRKKAVYKWVTAKRKATCACGCEKERQLINIQAEGKPRARDTAKHRNPTRYEHKTAATPHTRK